MNELITDDKKQVSILPAGVIFLALGGYVGEESGLNSRINCNKVIDSLVEFLHKNNCAVMAIDKKLRFVPIKENKRKRFLGLF